MSKRKHVKHVKNEGDTKVITFDNNTRMYLSGGAYEAIRAYEEPKPQPRYDPPVKLTCTRERLISSSFNVTVSDEDRLKMLRDHAVDDNDHSWGDSWIVQDVRVVHIKPDPSNIPDGYNQMEVVRAVVTETMTSTIQ